jgi:hypothetical protein
MLFWSEREEEKNKQQRHAINRLANDNYTMPFLCLGVSLKDSPCHVRNPSINTLSFKS